MAFNKEQRSKAAATQRRKARQRAALMKAGKPVPEKLMSWQMQRAEREKAEAALQRSRDALAQVATRHPVLGEKDEAYARSRASGEHLLRSARELAGDGSVSSAKLCNLARSLMMVSEELLAMALDLPPAELRWQRSVDRALRAQDWGALRSELRDAGTRVKKQSDFQKQD